MQIKRSTIDRLFQLRGLTLDSLLRFEVRDVARWLMYLGMFMLFYGSLAPWPLWPVYRYYHFIAFVPLVASMMLSHGLRCPIFTRTDYLYPTIACAALMVVSALCGGRNINGVVAVFITVILFYALFRLDHEELQRLGDRLAASLAMVMVVSIPFYIVYLLHLAPLPHHHVDFNDAFYTFENYYFFLVDDRFALDLIPRFHSIFLEPSHLGMACITLLYAQMGKWNTWRCRILFLALAMTFSLAAYICLVVMLFSASWMKGKAIMGKIIVLASVVAAVGIGSIYYNRGENLVNILIVQRLTVDDKGDMEGDNRTTGLFTKEFEKLMKRGEWLTGHGEENFDRFGFGNSGYRVFIYKFGVLSVLFLIVFLATVLATSDNRRAMAAFSVIMLLTFIAHGVPTKYYFFIPLYIFAFSPVRPKPALTDGSH